MAEELVNDPKHPLYPNADPEHEGMSVLDAVKQKLSTHVGTMPEYGPQTVVEAHKLILSLEARILTLESSLKDVVKYLQDLRSKPKVPVQ